MLVPSIAASAFCLRGTLLPPRTPALAVISILPSQSVIRFLSASELNPPNTTECTAPILAHAKHAIASSGIMGIYIITLSPFTTPRAFITLANLLTSE